MSLNNDITTLKSNYEKIEDQKNQLKSEAEETSTKKLNKISDLAKILMAIDSLEYRCLNRNDNSKLKYRLDTLEQDLKKPEFFNKFKERSKFSLSLINCDYRAIRTEAVVLH